MDDLSLALDLPDHLLILLQEKPEGRSEYELIQQLKRCLLYTSDAADE